MSPLLNTLRGAAFRSAGVNPFAIAAGYGGFRAFSRVTQKVKALNEAKSTFRETYAKLTAQPNPLGRTLWENSDRDRHVKMILDLQDETGDAPGKRRGKIGFHGSPHFANIVNQAFSNLQHQIEQRENSAGQGLFLGRAEDAVHFTGADFLLEIGCTGKIEENTQEGTNQNYIIPGTGDMTLLSIRKVSDEYKKHLKSNIAEIVKHSYRAAREVYHRTLGAE